MKTDLLKELGINLEENTEKEDIKDMGLDDLLKLAEEPETKESVEFKKAIKELVGDDVEENKIAEAEDWGKKAAVSFWDECERVAEAMEKGAGSEEEVSANQETLKSALKKLLKSNPELIAVLNR